MKDLTTQKGTARPRLKLTDLRKRLGKAMPILKLRGKGRLTETRITMHLPMGLKIPKDSKKPIRMRLEKGIRRVKAMR